MGAALAAGAEATIFYSPPTEQATSGAVETPVQPTAQPENDIAGNGASALPESESTNVWPDESAEAVFIAEVRGRGEAVVPVPPETVTEVAEKAKPLPKLDELVKRIPAETRELLDDLFRAKFVAVRRVKKADLKSSANDGS